MHLTAFLCFSVFTFLIFSSRALEYSNRWTVQVDGDSEEADRLARKHGFVNLGKVISLPCANNIFKALGEILTHTHF